MTQMRIARPSTGVAAIERFSVDGNPYWDTWGVTILDADSHRLVLCTRSWSNK